MKILVEVCVDNAAFQDDHHEIYRVLRSAGEKAYQMLHGGPDEVKLQDINGNTVGSVRKVRDD